MLVFFSIRSPNIAVGLGDSQSINLLSSFGHFCGTGTECNAKGGNPFPAGNSIHSRAGRRNRCQILKQCKMSRRKKWKEVKEGRQDVFAPFVGGPAGTLTSQGHIPCLLVDALLLPK
jgi:hypothetical protein